MGQTSHGSTYTTPACFKRQRLHCITRVYISFIKKKKKKKPQLELKCTDARTILRGGVIGDVRRCSSDVAARSGAVGARARASARARATAAAAAAAAAARAGAEETSEGASRQPRGEFIVEPTRSPPPLGGGGPLHIPPPRTAGVASAHTTI